MTGYSKTLLPVLAMALGYAQAAAPAPRVAVLVSNSTNSLGESVSSRRTMAVRGDGSEVEISQNIDPKTGRIALETHRAVFADRIIARWVPAIRSKSTRRSPLPDFQAYFQNARRDSGARCLATVGGTDLRKAAGEIDGGDDVVEGVKCVRVLMRNRNQPEIHTWYAPAIGCQLISPDGPL